MTTRAQDGSDADVETAVDTITVTDAPVSDTPTLTVSNASGNEDSAISLSISGAESDADGSETLSNYTLDLSGAPSGTTLSAGTNNGDGTWTLTSAQLSGLTISAPADYSGSFDVDVSLSSTDGAADAATTTDTITVTVAPVSDAPTLTVSDASGNEDSAISLSISGAESDADGSETLSNYTLDLSGAPSGTTLSAGTNNGDGTWTLTSAQLSGLTISAPADYSGSFDVDVSLSSTDGAADAATTTDTITVTVAPANSSPVFANDEAQTVSEEGLSAANADATGDPDTTNSATASGSLDVSDPDGDSLTYSLSSAATLSSRGEQITWTNDSSSTLMGSTVSSGEVVRVTVDSGGNYTVTLNGPVDHSDTSTEDTLVFNVTVRAEDGNGLSDEAVIAITVEDDAPILEEVTNLVLRDPTQTSFGVLDFQLGADERIVFTSSSNPFASLSFTGSVAGIAISAPSVSWASGDASGSTWDLSFNYSLEDGSQPNVATGNLSFDYTTDQYSFVLDEPLTRIVDAANSSNVVGYNQSNNGSWSTKTGSADVATSEWANNFYAQYQGFYQGSGKKSNELQSGDDAVIENGEIIVGDSIEVNISNGGSAGVQGNEISRDQVLDIDFFLEDPQFNTNTSANGLLTSVFFVVSGAAEDDAVVILKLLNESGASTTKTLVIETDDFIRTSNALSDQYGLNSYIDSGDAAVIIQSNDFNTDSETWKVSGLQIITSTEQFSTTTSLAFDPTSQGTASTIQEITSEDPNTSDGDHFELLTIGGVQFGSQINNSAELDFTFELHDADGDTITATQFSIDIDGSGAIDGTTTSDSLYGTALKESFYLGSTDGSADTVFIRSSEYGTDTASADLIYEFEKGLDAIHLSDVSDGAAVTISDVSVNDDNGNSVTGAAISVDAEVAAILVNISSDDLVFNSSTSVIDGV